MGPISPAYNCPNCHYHPSVSGKIVKEPSLMSTKINMENGGECISGEYVVKGGAVTVTASNGRETTGMIDSSMLSPSTLARVLLLHLHRAGRR